MDWNAIWTQIKDFFTNNGWNILTFIATFFLGVIVIKILLNITRRIFNRTRMEKITMQFLLGVIKFCLYLLLVLILLSIIGVQISGIVTALSAVILAIGVALEDNIANIANGIVIISMHMFNKGDYIIVDDVEGSITDINFLFTTIMTTDNRRITLPNSDIVNNPVTNNGANKTRRVQITFSVAYESDVELVKKVVTDVMKSNGKVYLDKDIFCRLKVLNSSSLDFYAYCWCDKEDYWDVYYYLIENVYNEFKRNNISVPFNQVEYRERTDIVNMPVIGKSLPKREEKVRETKYVFDLENADLTQIFKHKHHNSSKKGKKHKQKVSDEPKQDVMDMAIEKSVSGKVTAIEVDTSEKNENVKGAETSLKENVKKDESNNENQQDLTQNSKKEENSKNDKNNLNSDKK